MRVNPCVRGTRVSAENLESRPIDRDRTKQSKPQQRTAAKTKPQITCRKFVRDTSARTCRQVDSVWKTCRHRESVIFTSMLYIQISFSFRPEAFRPISLTLNPEIHRQCSRIQNVLAFIFDVRGSRSQKSTRYFHPQLCI